MKKVILSLGVASCAIAFATQAHAQTASAEDQSRAVSDTNSGEIIVTAQKREQRLLEVPMSITAATGDQLERARVVDVADLVKVTTGLTASTTYSGTPVYTIRGIGFYENSLAVSPAVSVYTDQVAMPYSIMTQGAALDVQRVEVLKGPQGTLFGQNSTGGAINFIPNKPTDQFEAGASLGYGNYNAVSANAFLSGPISDTVGVRVAGMVERRDGWQISQTRPDDRLGARDFAAGRILFDFKPTEALKLELVFNGWINRSESPASAFIAFKPGNPRGPTDNFPILASYTEAPRDNRYADWNPSFDYHSDDSFYQIALRGDLELNDTITLTSLTSYAKLNRDGFTSGDGTYITGFATAQTGSIESFSQELRLAGTAADSRLRWMLGGNYAKDTSRDNSLSHIDKSSNSGLGPFRYPELLSISNQDVETIAGFGSLEFEVTPSLTLLASARYTDSRNDQAGCLADVDGSLANAFANAVYMGAYPIAQGECVTEVITPTGPAPSIVPVKGKLNEDNFSWRGGFSWKPLDEVMVYGNVTRGYKSGAYASLPAISEAQLAPVKQEKITAYEAGFKAQLFDRRAEVSAALFHYDYGAKQLRAFIDVPIIGNLPGLVSIPKSKVDGGEVTVTLRPVAGLTLNAAATYVKSKVKSSNVLRSPDGVDVNVKGEPFPFTPEWMLSFDAHYDFPLSDSLNGYVGISPRYQSKSSAAFGGDSTYTIRGYTILDLRAGIKSADDRWSFEVWGQNVTDTFYQTNILHIVDTQVRNTGMPATYGARVGFKF